MQKTRERKVGLARAMSKLGFCSRSQATALIASGRVCRNGGVIRNPETPVTLETDKITVDGKAITAQSKVYLVMNKPRGLITTASDEKGRETIYSVLGQPGQPLPWVAPVGRLDKASEGLLLLTNDSEWGARLADPASHVQKTYHVQIATIPGEKTLHELERGVKTKEGDILHAKTANLYRTGGKNCWLEIVLDEGKNRHIRRMLDALGIEVLRLVRVAIGTLQLGELPKGEFRHLTKVEKQQLDRAIGKRSWV